MFFGNCHNYVSALYGYLFTDKPEAAFSNYRLWESLGFLTAFAYDGALCTYIKLYVCMGMLITGMCLYGVVEIFDRKEKASKIHK
jgi:hypothetical protein